LVVGAGVGGLCLAQGLRTAGVAVRVVERDPAGTSVEAYRLRLDAHGVRALHRCLPEDLVELFRTTCNPPHAPGVSILDHELTTLLAWDNEQASAGAVTNRRTLYEILLARLDDVVAFGRTVVGVDDKGDSVSARFADGSVETADVLVAADGVDSVVRGQLVPDAEVVDTGLRGVYGHARFSAGAPSELPGLLLGGTAPILGPDGLTLVVSICQPGTSPPRAAAEVAPYARLTDVTDCLQWTLVAPVDVLGSARPEELHGLALRLVQGWHPALVELVARSDPATASVVPIRAALTLPRWPTSRVTALGDAVHATTAVGGTGATTALRDAALLTDRLAEVAAGQAELLSALAAYEAQMREYGLAASLRSLRSAEQVFRVFIPELD
jgi:2-polyprenyl-6-methoxyphenol hydroxylase-like FAD-dependent oxidoreductase